MNIKNICDSLFIVVQPLITAVNEKIDSLSFSYVPTMNFKNICHSFPGI